MEIALVITFNHVNGFLVGFSVAWIILLLIAWGMKMKEDN